MVLIPATGASPAASEQRIALLEAAPPLALSTSPVPDLRVSAISAASADLFKRIAFDACRGWAAPGLTVPVRRDWRVGRYCCDSGRAFLGDESLGQP